MKALFLSVLALGITLTTDAQTIFKANFNQGDTTIYQSKSNLKINAPMGGTQEIAIKLNQRYVVLQKNNSGYRLEFTITKVEYEGNKELKDQMNDVISKYFYNIPMIYITNLDGKITKIENYDEAVGKASKNAIADIEELYKKSPNIEAVMPKIKAIMAISEQLSEKNLIEDINSNTFFYYYGKILKTGDKEERKFPQGIKGITTYTVTTTSDETQLHCTSKSNMTEKDVKQMIIGNMKKTGLGEEVTSQIENNWGQMQSMGMTTLTFNSDEDYTFLPSGWMTDYASNSTAKVMGMNMQFDLKTKIVSKNW